MSVRNTKGVELGILKSSHPSLLLKNLKSTKLIPMKKLTATICLTLAILLGSVGMSASADLRKGAVAYKSGDYATALREWTPLAEQGDAGAQSFLGMMYAKGEGVSKNYKTAVKWYKLAAEQGHARSQFILGLMYEEGKGVPQDYKTAVKWYKLAAEQGNADAQSKLGYMYDTGKGVPKKPKTALKWWKLAAEQGNATAQTNMGAMYGLGKGVIQDWVYAHMWGNLGASNGSEEGAKMRDLAAKQMTPSQLETAQKLARECVRKNYKGC